MKSLHSKINWKITAKCDMEPHCNFCYISKHEESDIEIQKLICDKLIELNPEMIVISGGEPTQCEELPEIIKKLRSKKIKICLATNGTARLEAFPDFYRFIDVITLPLEGGIASHSRLRSAGNFKNVINVLEVLRRANSLHKHNIQTLINTVALADNIDDLLHAAEIVDKYCVDVWKIFEHIHYEKINPNQKTPENASAIVCGLRKKIKNNKTIVRYETCDTRSNRYFMINPDGMIVIPTRLKENVFFERKIGTIADDPHVVFSTWEKECNIRNYSDSIGIFNLRQHE